jgi:hypothetical protein
MALSGRIPCQLNYVPAITAEDVTITKTQTQKVRKGAYGNYGRAAGIPQYEAEIKFGIPSDRAEFEQLAENAKGMIPGQDGFDFTYQKGTETYTLIDCGIASDQVTSDQDANAEQKIKLVAVDRIRVS